MIVETNYFRDEVRCGFYIPTAIKQSWAADLQVLAVLDEICKKHGISYFAEWGTLLGCVRHEGFVPWDDDLDVGMKREDYIRFRQVAEKELPEDFALQDFRNQEDHWLFITRIVNKNRICFDEDHLNRYYNYPYIAGIDIFVLDYLYQDEDLERQRDEEVKYILAVADGIVQNSLGQDTVTRELAGLEEKYKVRLPNAGDRRQIGVALYDLAERQMARTKPEESDKVGQIFPWVLKGKPGLSKQYYEHFIYLPFENTKIPVPAAYNELLRERYTEYLKVQKGGAAHDYPCFEKQKENLEEIAGGKLAEYSFDVSVLTEERTVDRALFKEAENILFLVAGPMYWDGFADLYQALLKAGEGDEVAERRPNITVVALPILPKDALGRTTSDSDKVDAAALLDAYPKEIPLTEWWDYDIRKERPDLVFIQDPYDGENPCLTIPKEYYTKLIRRFAGRIVYVPPFGKKQDDFGKDDTCSVYNLKHCLQKPGVVYSDLVLVASDSMKERYLEKLTEWAGADTKDYWDRKIQVQDFRLLQEKDSADPAYIREEGNSGQSQRRKKLLCLVGINELCEIGEDLAGLVSKKLAVLHENSDRIETELCFYPEQEEEWKKISAKGQKSLQDLVSGITRIPYSEVRNRIGGYDAYYGSASPLVVEFVRMKKPVMIAEFRLSL